MEKTRWLGLRFFVVVALAAVSGVAAWAMGFNVTEALVGGPTSNASMVWNVEYWHRNAEGEVLQYKKDHNTITVEGIDAAPSSN